MRPERRPITIFTPSFADEANTNAQNLTVKELVARLPAELFHITMLYESAPDPRIANRKNTRLLPYYKHGNAARLLTRSLLPPPDIYFFPRHGLLDQAWFTLHKNLPLRTAIVSYIVTTMNEETARGPIAASIRQGDAVFANSSYVRQTIQEKFGVTARTMYDGIDRRFFFPDLPWARQRQQLTVLYAGSFRPKKRTELVIQQAARWPNVIFRLAGQGETEAACRALVAARGCNNVIFLGHLSSAQLGVEMRTADIFLFPSIQEGHPQVLGQAAACGLPAIAMDVYHPEYVMDGETGFLVRSDAELGEKLDLLLNHRELRLSMSAAAARHALKFDWDEIAKRWMEAFDGVVASRRSC